MSSFSALASSLTVLNLPSSSMACQRKARASALASVLSNLRRCDFGTPSPVAGRAFQHAIRSKGVDWGPSRRELLHQPVGMVMHGAFHREHMEKLQRAQA